MRTLRIFVGFFNAPVLFVFWLTEHTVDSNLLSAPGMVRAAFGGSVTVSCQYDHQFRDNTKYWCKGRVYELCAIVVKTPRNRNNDRCSIADDKEAGIFTVTMTSLRQSDQDMYWCVIATAGRNVHTDVKLRISHAAIVTPTNTINTINTTNTTNTTNTINTINTTNTTNTINTTNAINTTPANSSLIREQDEIRWWVILRWIVFILMLCCLVSTHIAVWRIKAARKIQLHQQLHYQNIYESGNVAV